MVVMNSFLSWIKFLPAIHKKEQIISLRIHYNQPLLLTFDNSFWLQALHYFIILPDQILFWLLFVFSFSIFNLLNQFFI